MHTKSSDSCQFPSLLPFSPYMSKVWDIFHSEWADKKKVWDWFLRQIRKFIATQNCTLKALVAGSATTVPVRIKLFFYIVTQWQCGGIFMQLDFPNRFNCNFTFFLNIFSVLMHCHIVWELQCTFSRWQIKKNSFRCCCFLHCQFLPFVDDVLTHTERAIINILGPGKTMRERQVCGPMWYCV